LKDLTETEKRLARLEGEQGILVAQLALLGLRIIEMDPDGNCLFRTGAQYVLGDPK